MRPMPLFGFLFFSINEKPKHHSNHYRTMKEALAIPEIVSSIGSCMHVWVFDQDLDQQ